MTQLQTALLSGRGGKETSRLHGSGKRQGSLEAQISKLSAGNVIQVQPSGPTFAGPRPTRTVGASTFVPALSIRDRLIVAAVSLGWVISFTYFWVWWLRPEHRVSWAGLAINSMLLIYLLLLLPGYFLFAVNRLRRVNPAIAVPHLRVAFVVTRAPSEPWTIARDTLEAMLAQEFPHSYDVWLCDEQPSREIVKWCRAHSVQVSTRNKSKKYHRAMWPRRTRCKEGNLAYFYDRSGYRDYDVVAQLDVDHVPSPAYLVEMVRPFTDPAIGYVAAPSVCDANAANSWSARGRLHREAVFHGATQLGYSDGLAPFCIGSHYAVRTAALRDIGGLGPELAEDFSTTFLLTSAGWQGAFAIDAEAHGDGPATFVAMLTQEFQWSRSLMTLFYDLAPRHLGRMPVKLRIRFVGALFYYPLMAVMSAVGLALPMVAAVTGAAWVEVNYLEFIGHLSLISVWLLLMVLLLRRKGQLRPRSSPIMSWEGWLFILSRWPYVAWGIFTATLQKVRPRPITFRVTPKASNSLEPLPARLIAPYAVITLMLSIASLIGDLSTNAAGYVFLCLVGSLAYAAVSLAIPLLHMVETARQAGVRVTAAGATVWAPLLVSTVALPPLAVALTLFPAYLFPFLQK